MDNKITGVFIAKLRKEKGYTQAQLGELVGVSDKAVSKWERGICMPDHSTLKPVAEELGVTVADLINGEVIKKSELKEKTESTIQNSIAFYSDREKRKVIKWALFIIIPLILIIISLLALFTLNNYNKCFIYELSTKDDNLNLSSHIIVTNEKDIISLSNIQVADESDLLDINGYTFEYIFYINDSIIYRSGNVSYYEYDDNDQLMNITDYLSTINIYLSENKGQQDYLISDDLIDSNNRIEINYLDVDLNVRQYVIEFNTDKIFSNNKLIYSKYNF